MSTRWFCLPFLLCLMFFQSASAAEKWTEKSLGKASLRAAQAAEKHNWPLAIKYGEQSLEASTALDRPEHARYLGLLKNLNGYYDKAGRLSEVPGRVEKAYLLSRQYLGPGHPTTKVSRTLFYKLKISAKDYETAIPLVQENISLLTPGSDDDHKLHRYLKQLYSLYGLTGQLEREEHTLIRFLELDRRLYGSTDADNIRVLQNLANNYCRQRKLKEFNTLVTRYKLKFFCE